MLYTKNDKIILEIYRRMFNESKPKNSIDKIMKSGEGRMPNFFMAYYLSDEREEKIINEVLKEFKVPKWRWSSFRTEILLGSSPCSNKSRVDEERIDYTKRLKKFLSKLKKKK
jgi:hypothetical protein